MSLDIPSNRQMKARLIAARSPVELVARAREAALEQIEGFPVPRQEIGDERIIPCFAGDHLKYGHNPFSANPGT